MSTAFLSAATIASGVLAHLALWIRGEWDSHIGPIFLGAFTVHVALLSLCYFFLQLSFFDSYILTLYYEILHLSGTFASIIIYRIFFHRLRRFPGPLAAKVWIWYIFWRTWRSQHRQSIVLDELHAKYGPVVRYAPDRLSVNSAAAVPLVHGTGSTSLCSKSVVYLNPVNGGSINADRDVKSHHARRKIWERALSARVLPTYIPAFVHHTFDLISALQATQGNAVTVNHYIQLFTFDVMGKVGFGRQEGFGGLKTGVLNRSVATLIDMMEIGVYMMLVPWLHVLLDYVPTMGIIYKPDELFRDFAKETLTQYCGNDTDNETETTSLLNEKPPSKAPETPSFRDILSQIHPHSNLEDSRTLSDCVLLAIAGADTTTSSTVHILYRLARHRSLQTKLYEELRAELAPPCHLHSASGECLFAKWAETAKLPHLEAFIREVLRLHPPAPTGLPRLTPPEGLTIPHSPTGEHIFVPGLTNISVPVYSLLREAQNFRDPLAFVPERFLPPAHPEVRPDLVLDGRAFIPFLQGPYGCAGKHFAYLEMKVVVAGLLRSFEVVFPEGADVRQIERRVEGEWRDYSTVKATPVGLRFLRRGRWRGEEGEETC